MYMFINQKLKELNGYDSNTVKILQIGWACLCTKKMIALIYL